MAMRLGLRLLLVAGILLSGCIGSFPEDPDSSTSMPDRGETTSSTPKGAETSSSRPEAETAGLGACQGGTDDLFVRAQHHPGFTSYDYQLMFYFIDQNGALFYVRANDAASAGSPGPGAGRLIPKDGALHNVTVTEVREGMQLVGAWRSDRDYNVSQAFRDTSDAALLERFCSVVLEKFYDYEARYSMNNVADCDGFTFTITTSERGTHTSYSYCNAGPQDVRKAFDEMTRRSREKLGIEGI